MNERDLENHLRAALARKPAPGGFAGRVLARIPDQAKVRALPRPAAHYTRWLAAAAACLLLVAGSVSYRTWQQGQRARRDLVLALEIAANKFGEARDTALREAHIGTQIDIQSPSQ